jgi:hypothetical protein
MAAIQLTNRELAQAPFWDDYWQLVNALEETKGTLRLLGVTEFPATPPQVPPTVTGIPQDQGYNQVQEGSDGGSSLTDLIREACVDIQDNITTATVFDRISMIHPHRAIKRVSVGSILGTAMVQEGLIVRVSGGSGLPSVFSVTPANRIQPH